MQVRRVQNTGPILGSHMWWSWSRQHSELPDNFGLTTYWWDSKRTKDIKNYISAQRNNPLSQYLVFYMTTHLLMFLLCPSVCGQWQLADKPSGTGWHDSRESYTCGTHVRIKKPLFQLLVWHYSSGLLNTKTDIQTMALPEYSQQWVNTVKLLFSFL